MVEWVGMTEYSIDSYANTPPYKNSLLYHVEQVLLSTTNCPPTSKNKH